jgi:hypothetical protein
VSQKTTQLVEKLGSKLCERVLSGPGRGSVALAKALRGVRDSPKTGGEDFFKLDRFVRRRRAKKNEPYPEGTSIVGRHGLCSLLILSRR